MKPKSNKILAGMALAMFFSPALVATAQEPRIETQSRTQQALEHLRQAEQDLQNSGGDLGGHRVQAMQLIQQASREVQAEIDYDNLHRSGQSPAVRITQGPVIEYVDDDSAVIAWSTNVQGSSRVEYGTSPHNLTELAEAPWGADGRTHRVDVRNLQPDTTYYFEVETGQARGSGSEVESGHRLSFHTVRRGASALHNQQPR